MKYLSSILFLLLALASAGCRATASARATGTAVRALETPAAVATPTATLPEQSPVAISNFPTPTSPRPSEAREATIAATRTPAIPAGQPVSLQIPAINVDAAIEPVGKDSDGNMGVPQDVNNVAWYTLGARPGEVGSAVIAGHLDNYLQQPAVFWRLAELREGDTVTVTDDAGTMYKYEVTGMETYRYDQAPIARIFGSNDESLLNLITCRGEWDNNAQNYDERLVVYTRLVP